jgi:probable HAF family extracellular repeat protein
MCAPRIVLVAALLLAAPTHATPMFMGLGSLPGWNESHATAISDDGRVVVGQSGAEAFRWTLAGGMVGLGILPGGAFVGSAASDVSADGSVVVGQAYGAGGEAFRWSAADGMVGLGNLPGGTSSGASGVSANGSVIVGSGRNSSNRQEAFRWTEAGGMVGIGDLPGGSFSSAAGDISAVGSVVVGTSVGTLGFTEAFRWTESEGMIGLGDRPGPAQAHGSYAHGVSADGSVVVGQRGSQVAFRWTEAEGMLDLGGPLSTVFAENALDVSADGSVIVGSGQHPSFSEAFVWRADVGVINIENALMVAGIDLTGWQLLYASGISADGRTVVGEAVNPSGQREAWIAVLPDNIIPEPSTALLLATGLAGVAAARCGRMPVRRTSS